MCRFTFYSGPEIPLSALITEPRNSLINQSLHSEERDEPLNGDGFGVAWYARGHAREPAVFRSITPAWSNQNLQNIAPVVESGCILAHVRAASPGLGVSEPNCHPFRWQRYAFMHNGEIGGFGKLRRRLLAELSDESFASIRGTTDSEHMFGVFLDELRSLSSDDPQLALRAALEATLTRVLALSHELAPEERSYLNVAVSDGECAAISRCTDDDPLHAESLYLHRGERYLCLDGVCHMLAPGDDNGAVIVSSEKLSDDAGWEPIPVNHIVSVSPRREVELHAFDLGGRA